ncbi:MAG: CBS domain-containing protein [Acidobacteriota bacterium]
MVRSILAGKGTTIWDVAPDATVYEALARLAEKDIGALLVLEGDRLIGIFSERDYARKVILMGRSSREMQVHEVMTAPVVTVTPHHTVEQCMKLMTENRVRHLPVMDGPRLAGIVSIGDLVNSIISEQAETIQHLNNYITGSYV